jgi:electron transport complex protein RnfC
MSRRLWSFNGGVHPPQHKEESTQHPIAPALLPERLTLPLHQHIGEPAEPLVEIGERVLKGQVIARANGYVSAPVHAPTSGTVTAIGEYPIPHPSGLSADCLLIDCDGEDRWVERQAIADYHELSPSALRNLIREAGIVGLGGAGFPSYIKLNPGHDKLIKTLILNGVECEPYITCDDMLMRERPEQVIGGLLIARHALHAEECIIAIEDNKPEAIATMRAATVEYDFIDVVSVPTLYPQGSEKQLIKVLTGREVPSNGLSLQIGVVSVNVGTSAAIYQAIHHGEPLLSRIVTITGNGVARPRNLEVLIGTSMAELVRQCDGRPEELGRLVMGGPMMGFALHRTELPIIKTTNCVLSYHRDHMPEQQPAMPCIRCGACMDACPVNLLPQQLYWFARSDELEKAQAHDLFDCIECGCCSYVCPSNIPLVQYYRYAKGEIWIREREREKAELARKRFEFRQQRIERRKTEHGARRKAKQAATKSRDDKQAEIQAAMERAKQRRDQAVEQASARRQNGGPPDDLDSSSQG